MEYLPNDTSKNGSDELFLSFKYDKEVCVCL